MKARSRKLKNIGVGKRIRKARKLKGLTQDKLAVMVGVSDTYIGFIEQGQRVPAIKTADKIARILGIKLSDLFE